MTNWDAAWSEELEQDWYYAENLPPAVSERQAIIDVYFDPIAI